MKSYKSKKRPESTPEVNESFSKQLTKELKGQAKMGSEKFWEQLIGYSLDNQTKGEVVFESPRLKKSESATKRVEIQPGIEYHRKYYESITRFSENASSRETWEKDRQIQRIVAEIKKLAASTKSLQLQVGSITVQEAPVNPGRYDINFFEWMLIMVKQARQKVEDSKSWLQTLKGKKKKMGYWGMAKKHGTSFSQANERFVATSTG